MPSTASTAKTGNEVYHIRFVFANGRADVYDTSSIAPELIKDGLFLQYKNPIGIETTFPVDHLLFWQVARVMDGAPIPIAPPAAPEEPPPRDEYFDWPATDRFD